MSRAVKLYERSDALLILDDILAELEGELTPEAQQLLDEARGDFDAKAEAVAAKIRELGAFATAATTEAQRIAKLAKSAESQAESLSRYLLVHMQRANVPKIESPRFKISVRENPPKCEAVTADPSIVQTLRASLLLGPDDETPALDDEGGYAVPADIQALTTVQLAGAELDLLEACVIVTPEQVIPESRAWDKKALIALHKTHPATVAAVAQITRGIRLEIK